jgi:hypothetical protein
MNDTHAPAPTRKSYGTPRLVTHGSVTRLTQLKGGPPSWVPGPPPWMPGPPPWIPGPPPWNPHFGRSG